MNGLSSRGILFAARQSQTTVLYGEVLKIAQFVFPTLLRIAVCHNLCWVSVVV